MLLVHDLLLEYFVGDKCSSVSMLSEFTNMTEEKYYFRENNMTHFNRSLQLYY